MSNVLNRMGMLEFISIFNSLHAIDRDHLPEFSDEEWQAFRDHPVNTLKLAADAKKEAIWREVEKRQFGGTSSMHPLLVALNEYGMWINPDMFDQAADEITCDGSCEDTWRESDTNASGCYREERGEYCPFIVAQTLREVGKCARIAAQGRDIQKDTQS